jgi:glycerophosphoryl diester phosphodiesterase
LLVARHDPALADGRFVAALPAAETGLLRIADLFEDLPPDVAVDVDLKTSLEDAALPREATTAALVAELVREAGRSVLVTSFDPAALLIVRELAPAVPVGLLTWMRFPLRKAIPAAVHLGAQVVAPHVASFPIGERAGDPLERDVATSVRVAHAAGLQVAAWCPDAAQEAELAAAGVDCLVVDDVSTDRSPTPRTPA